MSKIRFKNFLYLLLKSFLEIQKVTRPRWTFVLMKTVPTPYNTVQVKPNSRM